MKVSYRNKSLLEIDREFNSPVSSIALTGEHLSIPNLHTIAHTRTPVTLSHDASILSRMNASYEAMMMDVKDGRPVYGTNSAFGGQAARILNKGDEQTRVAVARMISEGLVFLDISVGPKMPSTVVRSAMAIRTNMLLKGVSAVRFETLEALTAFLNHGIIPVVHWYGGIGASGDLAHNQRVVSALRGLKGTLVTTLDGKEEESIAALKKYNLKPLQLDPKEGLGLVNGDNFSTAVAAEVVSTVIRYYLIGVVVGAMVIETLKGTDRTFHPLLSHVRPHPGQSEVATIYRSLLRGSKLAYQELSGAKERPNGVKVQDGYSLRTLAQFEGVIVEIIKNTLDTITINANSTSDNPLWVPEELATEGEKPWQWVSGGNFLAMHMAEVLDQLRKVTTQLIKRNDRHLSRLIDVTENNGLPANLSDPEHSVTQCSFKGVQIQSGMFEIYSMVLANPVTTLFGTHEERNQDITAHSLTSGLLAMQNLELFKYSLAMNLLAVAQAVDLRGGGELLSPMTQPVYSFIRSISPYVREERPLHEDIEKVAEKIENGELDSLLREKVWRLL